MKNGHTILKEFYTIAPHAWLFGATLLGCVREGKILDWDKDIDVGYPCLSITDERIEKLKKAGFRIVRSSKYTDPRKLKYLLPKYEGSYSKIVVKKQGVKIEVCGFAEGKDGRLYYASSTPRFFVLDYDMVQPLVQRMFYDFTVYIPENAEKQLAFVYGDDWQTPKEQWYFTPAHYKRREHTIIELAEDDGSKWSKTTGRRVIQEYEQQNNS